MERHYPEQDRRKEMLRIIHEWTDAQPEAEPILRYHEFIELMGVVPEEVGPGRYSAGDVYQQAASHMNRFMRLVDEGYINARYKGEYAGGPPFTIAWIKGLSKSGLQAIEELPDPQVQTMQLLDDIAAAIRTLNDAEAPPEQKRVAERAINELKHFIRGLPPGVATELGARIFGA